jgi:acetylornithine deacetylase
MVAGSAVMEGRVGFVPGEGIEEVRKTVEKTVIEAANLDPWMKDNPVEIEWYGWKADAYEQEPNHALFQIIRRVSKNQFGFEVKYMGTPGGLDTRFFVRYGGIPSVCFGPGGDKDHGIDEYVVLEDVMRLTKILSLTVMEWCGC